MAITIGKNIKSIRLSKGLSRKQLSNLSGLSAGYIEEIENSKKNPTIDSLLKLSSVFKLTVSELIGETPKTYSKELSELIENTKQLSPSQIEAINNLLKELK